MHLQTIVALTDFSAAAEQAMDRAAMVAASHHARLRILYGTDMPDPKFTDPHARLEQRARQLARRHDIAVVAGGRGTGHVVTDALAAAAGADLLVMDRRAHFSWMHLLRGSPWARVLRGSRCPVLIVQNTPKAAYQHVLVAVDFSETAGALVRYAGGLQAEARLELYHAIDRRDEAKLRSAEASMQAIQTYRAEVREHARRKMLPLTTAFDTRRNRVATVLGAGDPARQLAVQHEASGADLIAVGYQRRPAPVEWLMGSIAGRLVGGVPCDVLVFPRDYALRQGHAGRGAVRFPVCLHEAGVGPVSLQASAAASVYRGASLAAVNTVAGLFQSRVARRCTQAM